MGWDRRAPDRVQAPTPPATGRWLLAAGAALLACVLLFLLHASERVPQLRELNIWALAASPLLIWILVFGARAHAHGRDLSHYQFLEEEAQCAQLTWQDWAQLSLAVSASCVVLPEQVSASVLAQPRPNLKPRTGQASRIAALPVQGGRALAGLQLLVPALTAALQALPVEQALRVTVLSDVEPEHYPALRDAWQQTWAAATGKTSPATVNVTRELSFQWIDETLRTASTAVELILVLQVNGAEAYSDGLAALLLCPDRLARAWELPVLGELLRPMPLDITALKSELPLFLQTQTNARLATGLLADGTDWQPVIGEVLATGSAQGASLKVEQQWVLEHLCGLPGPFSHWLLAALGVDLVRHQRQPLVLLAKEKTRHWISTVTKRELA
ncbi:hypothetical protein [Pseudomonas laurylsulfatiphila]|uniref:hypothetical protein n=1 Tax=Pseudomonas laurylsulfatiphila TaxID=2011015 RepID=UPI003D1B3240